MEFRAFLIDQKEGQIVSGFSTLEEAALDPGEVSIRVAYSSINYKDALAATGAGRIIRRFPCVGGIDLAGTVVRSTDERFAVGDRVIAGGYSIGVAHHGGYAQRARLPADWVMKCPAGLTLRQAMAYGTAGFTAGLALQRMCQAGLSPEQGPVIVSGATGGVGSIAISLLAQRGYQVSALTGKDTQDDVLKSLGATAIVRRQMLDGQAIKPLSTETWAGAIDNLGGDVLAWMLSTMKRDGVVSSIGLAASASLQTTVMPFILRGVRLLGIDSGFCSRTDREAVWSGLVSADVLTHLESLTREISFDDLPNAFSAFIAGEMTGRVVVRINP